MKNKKNILANFETTIQVSEDSWRVVWVHKIFDENTKIKEIIDWAKGMQFHKSTELDLRGLVIKELE